MTIILRADIRSEALEAMLKAAGARAPVAIARALNRTGAPTSSAYMKKATAILGLKRGPYAKKGVKDAIRRKTSIKKANPSSLRYSHAGWGDGFPLIYYQPKEAREGATVNWLGQRKLIARSFYLGGQFPKRKRSKISHAVWRRQGAGRWNLDRPKGPGMPQAMAHPDAARVWESEAAKRLPARIAHELSAIFAGYAPGEWRTWRGVSK